MEVTTSLPPLFRRSIASFIIFSVSPVVPPITIASTYGRFGKISCANPSIVFILFCNPNFDVFFSVRSIALLSLSIAYTEVLVWIANSIDMLPLPQPISIDSNPSFRRNLLTIIDLISYFVIGTLSTLSNSSSGIPGVLCSQYDLTFILDDVLIQYGKYYYHKC